MKYLLSLILFSICLFSSCGGDGDDPGTADSEATRALATLSNSPWTMKSVSVDGVAKDNLYAGLKLTFLANGNYSAVNGGAVWTSGSITMNADGKSFTRSDGTAVTIDQLTATDLVLSLNWSKTTIGSGRASSLAGKHLFTFGK